MDSQIPSIKSRHVKMVSIFLSMIFLTSKADANFLQLFKPKEAEVQSFEQCLLENLTGIESDAAVSEIRRSCRTIVRNAERATCNSNITEQMQGALQGRLGHRSPADHDSFSSGIVSGNIYNMSHNYRVTIITISVSGVFNEANFTKDLSSDVWLNPLTESIVSFGSGMRRIENFSWRIKEVSGCRTS